MQLAKSLLCASLLSIAAIPAFAKDGEVLENRLERQGQRIEQGKESGELNENEAARLEKRQENIDKRIDHAKSDGEVTRGEKRRISRAQNRENKAIAVQKHDRQRHK